MLLAVLIFCLNYAQIMPVFRNYATCFSNYSDCKISKISEKMQHFFIYHYSWKHFLALLAIFLPRTAPLC